MGFNIITEYPLWYLLLCLLAGAVYAGILYYKNQDADVFARPVRWLLAGIRFVLISFLAFLLLSPLIKTVQRHTERPIVVVAQDNSQSILIGKDSSYYNHQYKQALNQLITSLGNKYDVRQYQFGDKIQHQIDYSFNEKQTDMADLFSEINDRYSNTNIGAVIVASDGLFNKGMNPVYASSELKVPVYTIALGDTTVKKDLILTKVDHNRFAYLGNTFPLSVLVDARELKGSRTTLSVVKDKQTLFTRTLDIPDNTYHMTVPVELKADKSGIQHYEVRLSPVKDEVSVSNNTRDVFINVIDNKQKVLILANAPHPDVAQLRFAIEKNQNYEVESAVIGKFNKPIQKYNLVILDQLPSVGNAATNVLKEINKSDVPVLYIVGAQSSLPAFNTLQTGLTISENGNKSNETVAAVNPDFSLFTLSDALKNYVKDLPALQSPFATYKLSKGANVLFYQQIGSVETQDPLLFFNQVNSKKIGVIVGEGIWRWRLQDFEDHNNHDIFNELIDKTVQYLAVKEDKSFFRVHCKNRFNENEPVEFDAEVYNATYELINKPEVEMTITNSENKKFPFTFSKTTHAYHLNAGMFPVGNYHYEASVAIGDKQYHYKGEFSVRPLQVEYANTIADHQLMYQLAESHGGKMLYPQTMGQLPSLLAKRDDIKSVVYSAKKLDDLINLKWLFFVLLLLLATEWFVRKRSGSY